MYKNKKIFILGMARSGYEVAKLLAKYNNEILVTDQKEQDINHVYELESLGVSVKICENPLTLFDSSYDVLVKNPGIKYNHPVVEMARERGIRVVNELEVAYSMLEEKPKIIGVTGSNGKTTTVTLIYAFLKRDLDRVYLCGNIGTPVCSLVNDVRKNDIMVIEVSDHQLCDVIDFKTDISVLTNISETHIDFHDSYEKYKEMKKRIFAHHTESDIAIINLDYEESVNLTNDISSKKYYFSKEKQALCYIKDDSIYYNDEEVIKLSDIRIKGMHNYENIMAAIIAVKEFNIKNESIKEVLKNFKGVEHRIEFVKELNGRKFYNDSKSTNNKATIIALSSFTEPTILLMGGLDRGIPFDDLAPYLTNVKKINAFGETKEKILEFSNKNNIPCEIFDTMKPAIINAYQNSQEGDVILLSPACASWDQYERFEDRGNEFKEEVRNLK
jgi:UDP-N-acetylmuramoylalanine--D-glutamate ligase